MSTASHKRIAIAAISAGIAALALLSVAGPAQAQQNELVAVYEQFVDHLNAGELDEALALMTDDAFFPPDNVGKAAIREELENRKADSTQVTVINPRVVGDTVESEWTLTSDCLQESGLGSFGGTTTIEFVDGRISADLPTLDLDLTDEQFAQLAEATACTEALAQEPDLVAIYEQFVGHLSAGELDHALALMTEDSLFPPNFVGKDAIRAEFERRKADNAQTTIISAEEVDGTVVAEWTFTSDCVRESGLGSFIGTSTVEFVGDKISAGRPEFDLTEEQFAQLAEALVCTAAKGQALPAAGTGGPPTSSGLAIWWYALAAAGTLLTIGGFAFRRTGR